MYETHIHTQLRQKIHIHSKEERPILAQQSDAKISLNLENVLMNETVSYTRPLRLLFRYPRPQCLESSRAEICKFIIFSPLKCDLDL